MRTLENVPDPLKQKFLPLDSSYEIEYAKHIHIQDGYNLNVKYLMDCSGEFTSYAAFYCANKLVLRKIHDAGLETQHIFDEELMIQGVEYMRRADACFDLVVTLNSTKLGVHPHCVTLLRWTGARLKQLRKLRIEDEICCIKVIADEVAMEQLESLLHPRMSSWPHIIAVGTRLAHCYLLHIQLSDRQHDDGRTPIAVKLTDGLKPFHSGDNFVYTWMDHGTGSSHAKKLPLVAVYVTCLSFLEKSRTVLVGFSFGGIMTISLTSCPTIDSLVYPCSAAVQFISTLEPDDDPRCHLWFFVAYGTTKVKPLQLCLYEVMFPEEEALSLCERTWNKPVFNIKLMIPFPHTVRWVSAQTLVRDRAELRGSDDSTRDSFRSGSDKDRSLMFFSYIANDRHGFNLKGGLFDLNAYYYKRLVQVIIPDGTLAQQSAFLSNVHHIPVHHKEEDFSLIKDLAVDTTCLTRFISNASDAEQMFYPSTYEIFVVHVAGVKKCYQLTLPSLPNQLLSTICADLELHMSEPSSASAWLSALGFPRRDAETTEQRAKLSTVLSALISHQRAMSVVQFIKHSESTESRYFIATWIWEEIGSAAKKMHETIEPLFARFSAPLSPAGRKSLALVHDVFVAGTQILRELVSSGVREQDATREYIISLEAQRFATENLRSYSAVIHQLIRSKILPVAEDREIRIALEEAVQQRRAKVSGHMLYVDKLVARMQSRSKSEPFWLAEGPKWYPPALLNLLGPILLLYIPTKAKGQLLAYYLFDYANCRRTMELRPYSSLNLIDLVATQMHGLLGMNKEELGHVYRSWCSDVGMSVNNNGVGLYLPSRLISAENEVKQLMCIPRPLSADEEEKLRTLTKSVRLGEFAWQCYLVRNKRYEQFTELPVPPNENNEFVVEYRHLLPIVRMLLRNRGRSPPLRLFWPPGMKDAIEKFEKERCNSSGWHASDMTIFNRGSTPKPFGFLNRRQSIADALVSRKRHGNTPLLHINSSCTQISVESEKTPSIASKRALLNFSDDENASLPVDIPASTLNTIADILRTPQTRARAAAQAESQRKWVQKTPEEEFEKPAPRSILKSARAPTEGVASPSRNRLQFDLPSSSQSSLSQTIPDASPAERMIQPDFDDSLENEESPLSSAATEECGEVEEEEDKFDPYISPASSVEIIEPSASSNDVGEMLEKSIEIQDEEDCEDITVEKVSVVEQQDEEEEKMDINEVCEKVLVAINKGKQGTEDKWHINRREVVEEVNESFVEKQDEEEEEITELVDDLGEEVEKQDEQELWEEKKLQSVEQEKQDELDVVEEASTHEKPSKGMEVQDEHITKDAVNIVRYESLVEGTVEMAYISGQPVRITEQSGHVIRSTKICSQIDDGVAVAEIQNKYGEDALFESSISDSEDHAESTSKRITRTVAITSPDLNTQSRGSVKLVEYSCEDSSFECTTLKKSQKELSAPAELCTPNELDISSTNDDGNEALANTEAPFVADQPETHESKKSTSPEPVHDGDHSEVITNDTSGVGTIEGERAQCTSTPPTKHDLPKITEVTDLDRPVTACLERAKTLQPSEQNLSNSAFLGRQRSSENARASAPPTPVRHSQRLKDKLAESHVHEADKDERTVNPVSETSAEKDVDVDGVRTPSPIQKAEGTPHLSMSLRRSPARSRKAAKKVDLAVPESGSQPTKVDETGDAPAAAPTRTLRPRTPTRSRQDTSLSSSAPKITRTPRRVSESSGSSEATIGSARKSPSRTAQTRKLSTLEEEVPLNTQMSSLRRAPTRSSASSNSGSELTSKAKGVKALHQKLGTGTDLFEGMDPRTYFDSIMKKHTNVASGSRRRTRSDSEVPEIRTMKLKKMKLAGTFQDLEEEEADVATSPRGHSRSSTHRVHGNVGTGAKAARSSSRPRRASSVIPAKQSPGRTRRTSGSSVSSGGATATPKSPSRRGRPRGIETIAE